MFEAGWRKAMTLHGGIGYSYINEGKKLSGSWSKCSQGEEAR